MVREIRESSSPGRVLAHRFGVHVSTIGKVRRGEIKGAAGAPAARVGHVRGAQVATAKLTEAAVRAIRADPDTETRVLAARYGVGPAAIRRVRRGASWNHLS